MTSTNRNFHDAGTEGKEIKFSIRKCPGDVSVYVYEDFDESVSLECVLGNLKIKNVQEYKVLHNGEELNKKLSLHGNGIYHSVTLDVVRVQPDSFGETVTFYIQLENDEPCIAVEIGTITVGELKHKYAEKTPFTAMIESYKVLVTHSDGSRVLLSDTDEIKEHLADFNDCITFIKESSNQCNKVSARNSETNSQDMCDESRVNLIKEITHVADPTDDATSISFQRFLKILKQYWLKLITTTNQDLVIDYFHKDGYNFTEWFELIKNSPVTHYLQTIRPGGADFDIVLHKKSNHEEFKDALVFTSLVLSYSNNLLKLLKNNLPAEKISAKMKHFCEAVDTVSSFIAIFQALMPWSFTACLKELEIQMDSIQTDIDNVVFAFDDQQLVDLEFFKTLIVYDVDILCSVLGLQTQFSQFAKHVSVHMWLHDMQASNVVNWLKRNYESMSQAEANTETMSPSGILSQKLIFLGFTKRKAASIAENISEDWIYHQTALELATTHILDMFQCHPVLTVASGFPYSSTVTDALFDQTVELNDGNTVSERSIKVINVSNMNNTDIQSDFQKHIKNSVPNGNIKLFHGTSHEDAKSILTKGIRLGRGRQFQDFSHGDGFYLSYVFNHAKERAIHKSKRPAIIVYRIAEVTLQEFDGLSLHDDIVCWRTTVKFCRKGYEGLMPKDFTDFHYIDGPMCRNPEGVIERNQEPATHVEEKKQLCVKKPDFAKVFNHPDNIVCVVFYREHIE